MFCRHSSSLQPHLTEQHMAARFAYALDEVHPVQGRDGCYRLKDLYDKVDVDEKWFYLTRKSEAYILIAANDEDDEGESHVYRAVKNTKHLKMVMFLCTQARPRWDHNANQMWDGKIGMWPIGQFQPAARASVNQPRGAPVWHIWTDIGHYFWRR